MTTNKISVNIFGSEYALKTDQSREYIIEIANYIDQKMKEIDKTQTINSKFKIAILAALNITDELFQEKQYRNRLFNQLNEESKQLNRSLQEAFEL
jgi:cell division protein ZapA